ncbi:MAG TPA: hypothetical protein VMV35_07715 [Halothiobacillus sp.]|nr:hypothetical protein [Halothiobacillus sp.]
MKFRVLTAIAILLAAPGALAQTHESMMPMMHHHDQGVAAGTPEALAPDTRRAVRFPRALREHTLASMRDHLLTLQKIQAALAKQDYDLAGNVAEQRLGMSSMALHDADEVAKYMPKGMQQAGLAMHRSASRFALAAGNAGATGDVKPALEALSEVTANCVACHAAYRLK